MKIHQWLALITALLHLTAWSATRPNVLLIITDNQSPGLLGAYGNRDILTPNIDRLATEGLLFEQAYATSGVCSPTRATLLTGLLPSQTGVHNGLPGRFKVENWSAIEEFRNLPQTLADAGYRTGMVGKYHLGDHTRAQLGFEFWTTFRAGHTVSFVDVEVTDNGKTLNVADLDMHITDYWTQRSVDFITQQTTNQPFFLMLSYNGPYILPPTVNEPATNRHADYYANNPPVMPQFPVHSYLRTWAMAIRMKRNGTGSTLPLPWAAIDALNNQRSMNKIAAEMTMVDDGIGVVLEALEQSGLADNTLVVFMSDQGSAYGQLGLWGNSSWGAPAPAYRANMQIPLIFRHPGRVPAGQTNALLIDEFDLFPTLLDYLGLGELQIANTPGRSFAPALRGKRIDWEDTVFFEYIDTRVIQTRDWKYTERFLASPNELYDLTRDPGETQNLINNPEFELIAQDLAEQLAAFFNEYAEPRYDIWRGGTAKSTLFYGGRNRHIADHFPGWIPPVTEKAVPFTDR
ncbi:MAG TPA: sulfatase-like hydrolase/transferase [Gammaproteobacteria bacterium]|nr:sulfatase-like hydrolase/transferase [Gammaproteobacteria bacterium]MDP7660968.1 sulfatase-like hydrolase/transferase [Gammaproteobacteria bacterium]HJP38979.1 sulfatase-like hydrolase/transferase [Gammaproteobacteria bacterium]